MENVECFAADSWKKEHNMNLQAIIPIYPILRLIIYVDIGKMRLKI